LLRIKSAVIDVSISEKGKKSRKKLITQTKITIQIIIEISDSTVASSANGIEWM
jgi:hypothetical protein